MSTQSSVSVITNVRDLWKLLSSEAQLKFVFKSKEFFQQPFADALITNSDENGEQSLYLKRSSDYASSLRDITTGLGIVCILDYDEHHYIINLQKDDVALTFKTAGYPRHHGSSTSSLDDSYSILKQLSRINDSFDFIESNSLQDIESTTNMISYDWQQEYDDFLQESPECTELHNDVFDILKKITYFKMNRELAMSFEASTSIRDNHFTFEPNQNLMKFIRLISRKNDIDEKKIISVYRYYAVQEAAFHANLDVDKVYPLLNVDKDDVFEPINDDTFLKQLIDIHQYKKDNQASCMENFANSRADTGNFEKMFQKTHVNKALMKSNVFPPLIYTPRAKDFVDSLVPTHFLEPSSYMSIENWYNDNTRFDDSSVALTSSVIIDGKKRVDFNISIYEEGVENDYIRKIHNDRSLTLLSYRLYDNIIVELSSSHFRPDSIDAYLYKTNSIFDLEIPAFGKSFNGSEAMSVDIAYGQLSFHIRVVEDSSTPISTAMKDKDFLKSLLNE